MIDISAFTGDLSPINLPDVFAKRPLLQSIFEKHKNNSLPVYVKSNLENIPTHIQERQEEFLECIREILSERLDADVVTGVVVQLRKYYAGSSADHHGTLNSCLAISSNLLMASGFREINDPVLKYLIVFSCASVSLNNEDYPQGILFHQKNFHQERVAILPRKYDNSVVYGFRAYKKEEIENTKKIILERMREGTCPELLGKNLQEITKNIFEKKEILSASDLCAQFTKINFELWQTMFAGSANVPDMVYIEFEEIVARLIRGHHLHQETLIQKFIFDPESEETLRAPLTKIMEKYLRQGNLPTYLFWGISDTHKRVKLIKTGKFLYSEDDSIRIALDPESIAEALQSHKLMPNLFLVFLVLHLYYGVNCIGGFNQIHYLDAMQKFYQEQNIDENTPSSRSSLYQYGLDLVNFTDEKGAIARSVSGIDFLLHERLSWDEYLKKIEKITFGEAFQSSARIIQSLTE